MKRSYWIAFALGFALFSARALSGQAPNGGNGTIYYGTYDKKVLVIDEATLSVRDSMPLSISCSARTCDMVRSGWFWLCVPTVWPAL